MAHQSFWNEITFGCSPTRSPCHQTSCRVTAGLPSAVPRRSNWSGSGWSLPPPSPGNLPLGLDSPGAPVDWALCFQKIYEFIPMATPLYIYIYTYTQLYIYISYYIYICVKHTIIYIYICVYHTIICMYIYICIFEKRSNWSILGISKKNPVSNVGTTCDTISQHCGWTSRVFLLTGFSRILTSWIVFTCAGGKSFIINIR